MAKTLIRIFLDAVSQHRKPALFMRRLPDAAGGGRWESISSERARGDVESLALGLAALGVRRGERVALLSENRYEWAITDLATLGQGAITVPIYPTLTAAQSRYILDNSESRVCVRSRHPCRSSPRSWSWTPRPTPPTPDCAGGARSWPTASGAAPRSRTASACWPTPRGRAT